MNFALVYLGHRALFRVADFIHHWYIDASRAFLRTYLSAVKELGQQVALRVTLAYFFQPLYKDYSVVGRVLGPIFRSGRIFIGLVMHGFLLAGFLLVYAAWVLVPPAIIWYAFNSAV